MHTMRPMKPIERAVKNAGGIYKLAKQLNVLHARIWNWVHRGDPVSPDLCIRIEEATGVSRYDLRPDVFGAKPKKSA